MLMQEGVSVMSKGITHPLDFDKETNLQVKWLKTKNTRGMSVETTGKKLPREIQIMLVNSLLRDLKIDIEIGRHG